MFYKQCGHQLNHDRISAWTFNKIMKYYLPLLIFVLIKKTKTAPKLGGDNNRTRVGTTLSVRMKVE